MATAAGLPAGKAFLGLTTSPNLSFWLIRTQHDSSMPNASTLTRFVQRGASLLLRSRLPLQVCPLRMSRGGTGVVEIQRWGKTGDAQIRRRKAGGTFCNSSKGLELSPWVQGDTPESCSPWKHLGPWVQGLMSTEHLQTMRSTVTKTNFQTILNHYRRTSSAGSQIKPHQQVQSVISSVKLWKLPSIFWGENNSGQLVSVSVLFLEHKHITCQLGNHC